MVPTPSFHHSPPHTHPRMTTCTAKIGSAICIRSTAMLLLSFTLIYILPPDLELSPRIQLIRQSFVSSSLFQLNRLP